MAKVLFSITDAQLRCLVQLQAGAAGEVDQRTLTGLQKRQLIAPAGDPPSRYVPTPQGSAVIALCEMLAIASGKDQGRRKA